MSEDRKFQEWAIVDLFGHQRVAGRVTEQQLGGETFIRVDIPKGEGFYTRMFGKGAIYGISLVDEAIAREVAKNREPEPVNRFEMRHMLEQQTHGPSRQEIFPQPELVPAEDETDDPPL